MELREKIVKILVKGFPSTYMVDDFNNCFKDLETLFSKVIKEIIGEDELRFKREAKQLKHEVRNELRAEQRIKLIDILNSRKDKKV